MQTRIAKMDRSVLLLLFIIALYSFSYAWPKTIGLIEIVIGVLLIIWLFKPMLHLFYFSKPILSITFFSLLVIPLAVGTLHNGNEMSSVIRDVIPYFYITIPMIFLATSVDKHTLKQILKYIPWFLSFTGVIFALREFYSNNLDTLVYTSSYLMQSPAVLFTAIFCSLYTIEYFLNKRYLYALLCFTPSIITVGVLYFTVLRAPIALWLLSIFIYVFLKKLSLKNILYIIMGLIITIFSFEAIKYTYTLSSTPNANTLSSTTISNSFLLKQQRYGANGKIEELILAKKFILHNDNSMEAILGKGFGGKWYSPAAGGEVRFTHSLLTYMILKMGLLGLVIFSIYLLLIFKVFFSLLQDIQENPMGSILLLAILGVFTVNLWLESGYKTLDFGIISLLYFSYYYLTIRKKTLLWV